MQLLGWSFLIVSLGNDCRMFAYCFFLVHRLESSFFLSFIWTKRNPVKKNFVYKLAL